MPGNLIFHDANGVDVSVPVKDIRAAALVGNTVIIEFTDDSGARCEVSVKFDSLTEATAAYTMALVECHVYKMSKRTSPTFDAALDLFSIIASIELTTNERWRQVKSENYSAEHDNIHTNGSLGTLAASYLVSGAVSIEGRQAQRALFDATGFSEKYFKPGPTELRKVVKGAALALAELARVIRKNAKDGTLSSEDLKSLFPAMSALPADDARLSPELRRPQTVNDTFVFVDHNGKDA